MKTKVLIKMDIVTPAARFKVVSIQPYKFMLQVGEPMKYGFLGSILAFRGIRPREQRGILGDSENIVLGITFVEPGVSTQISVWSFEGFITASASPVSSALSLPSGSESLFFCCVSALFSIKKKHGMKPLKFSG